MKPEKEICANCDREIGRLEDAFLWKDEPVCGECHARLSGEPIPIAPTGVQTIEKTAKLWKALQLIGGAVFGVSLIVLALTWYWWGVGPAYWISAALMIVGLGVGAYAQIAAWWHHG